MNHHDIGMGQYLTSDDPDGSPEEQSTQEATQEAHPTGNGRSQDQDDALKSRRSWGFLQPCSRAMSRADFEKIHPTYSIGRGSDCHIRLRGNKVSNSHCLIKWDGRDERDAVVTVTDTSSNGTFINGEKIGRGNSRILRDGNEIAFGTPIPGPPEDDYRFIYRQITGGPIQGLWAEYDMGSELGKGSFATVFGALHRKTGTWHAVKIIQLSKVKPGPGDQLDANGRVKNPFQREISVMESLRHRNICRMKEVFIEPDTLDIVLELVKGGDLLDRILKRGGLPEDETRDIVYQICDALAYVHSQGIAHRDLKPENILLTDDEPPIVKVADFGLAKIADSMTMLRTMCGTPSYLAPEVVDQKNNEGYDHAVDSWSVGVIVFSMLTNTAPFIEDERIADLKLRILNRTIDWETLHSMNLSYDCVNFVQRLLERDVRKRMSLTDSLHHQWLSGYIPVHQRREMAAREANAVRNQHSAGSFGSSTSTIGPVMRDLSILDDSSMSIDGDDLHARAPGRPSRRSSSHGDKDTPAPPGAYPPSGEGATRHQPGMDPASPLPAGATSPNGKPLLMRRAHVLAQAAEGGSQLLEPSADMVHDEDARRRAERTVRPTRGRAAKRKAPVEDHYSGNAVLGSQGEEEGENTPNKRVVRGKGRATPAGAAVAAGTRRRGTREDVEGEVPQVQQVQPRRSGRKRL